MIKRARVLPIVFMLITLLLAGCSSVAPCDHRDLHGQMGFVCLFKGYRHVPSDAQSNNDSATTRRQTLDANPAS